MTEFEKMKAGLPFSVRDPEMDDLHAVKGCQKLNAIDVNDSAAKEETIRELFGKAGKDILP